MLSKGCMICNCVIEEIDEIYLIYEIEMKNY